MIDLTIPVSIQTGDEAAVNEKMVSFGHLGTHFDVMNKQFPLEFTKRKGIVFNVLGKMEIDVNDVDLESVKSDMFVSFYSGFIDEEPYGTQKYFTEHPQISRELIDLLLEKKISMIGIDFSGVRRGAEHTPMDGYCADNGVFIIENLCNLDKVLDGKKQADFTAGIYPVNFTGISGLPCRVIAYKE